MLDGAVVTFSPGAHFWSTVVTRVRMDAGQVPAGVDEIRRLMRSRGRSAAAWSLGPSATPVDVLDQLVALGFELEGDVGSRILVLEGDARIEPAPLKIRVVSTLVDHVAAIEVSIERGSGSPMRTRTTNGGARLRGERSRRPFRYKDAGSLATIGKRAAVVDFGWVKLTGRLAWWLWGVAHIYFLIGLRHRLTVALSWLWIYLTGKRSARLITQDEAKKGGIRG